MTRVLKNGDRITFRGELGILINDGINGNAFKIALDSNPMANRVIDTMHNVTGVLCPYCKEPITENEHTYDESDSSDSVGHWYGYHWSCIMDDNTRGTWHVVNTRDGSIEKSYTSELRANEMAQEYASWNPGMLALGHTFVVCECPQSEIYRVEFTDRIRSDRFITYSDSCFAAHRLSLQQIGGSDKVLNIVRILENGEKEIIGTYLRGVSGIA
jgi:hypothetical protein